MLVEDWMLHVLSDLRVFAQKHAYVELDAALEDAARLARESIEGKASAVRTLEREK